MKALWLFAGLILFLTWPFAHAGSLQVMNDEGLGEVSAQQGIAVDLEYRINSKADGEPVDLSECPTVGVLSGGSSCRIAYSLADSSGMWIVLKGYRGITKLNNIFIDAANLEGDWTVRTGGPRPSGGPDPDGGKADYKNPYSCLARNSSGVCTEFDDPLGKPALQLTAGNWRAAGCGANSNASCFSYMNNAIYADMSASMYIEKMTAEFDSSTTIRDGYLKNAIPGAPIALRIAHGVGLVPDPNNPPDVMIGPYGNAPAQIRLDGRLQIYGFGF